LQWENVLGNGTATGVSVDGTDALTAAVFVQDIFVNKSGTLFFYERGVLRYVNQNGKIATMAGASRSAGDNGPALQARIGEITDFKLWNNGTDGDHIVFSDNSEFRFRQFKLGGNIETIAGNGSFGDADTVNVAVGQPISGVGIAESRPIFQVNASTGAIYSGVRGRGVSVLDQVTRKWAPIVGYGSPYYNVNGDGRAGSLIGPAFYSPIILGITASQLLVGWYGYGSGHRDGLIKSYPLGVGSTYTQSAFAGIVGLTATLCDSATALTSCVLPPMNGMYLYNLLWDSELSAWVGGIHLTNRVFKMIPGGNLVDIVNLPANAYNLTIKHNATENYIYYCSGTDRKLHRYNVNDANPATADYTYAWPIPKMECSGRSLIYSPSRGSLIFSYELNGLWGVAEYLSP
jgi:hypothetical protein